MHLVIEQFLFTNRKKYLSGGFAAIRQIYEQCETTQAEYKEILKEAIRLTEISTSIEDAFFAYAKNRIGFPPRMLADYLKKAADYCHLKQPLLGMTDLKTVYEVQKKVTESVILRIRFGKDTQTIRNVTQLYYDFIKSYQVPKAAPVTQGPKKEMPVIQQVETIDEEKKIDEAQCIVDVEKTAQNNSEPDLAVLDKPTNEQAEDLLWVDFSMDDSYMFTKPVSYIYKGLTHEAKSWNRLYVELCGLFFTDYHNAFMGIINGDIPGYNALAFADEKYYQQMREPKSFADGYYVESNLDATSIVRKIRALSGLFNVGDDLRITYRKVKEYHLSLHNKHRELSTAEQLSIIDADYDWKRDDLLLVDFVHDASYAFTQPEAYEYSNVTKRITKWGKLYADLCGKLFEDYHDSFMTIVNGDIPGYNTLAFADEHHKGNLRVARCFAPGHYLESNMDSTAILRRIRGLYQLFSLGDKLRISYRKARNKEMGRSEQIVKKEWIIIQLEERGLTYQDKRAWSGCLWIVGGHELDEFIYDCKLHGYTLSFKPEGCKTYPNKAVWWTKDQPESQILIEISPDSVDATSLDAFRRFLLEKQDLAERTADNYCRAILKIEEYIQRNNLNHHLRGCNADEMQSLIDVIMARPDFEKLDRDRHRQFLAAMKQYLMFLRGEIKEKPDFIQAREAFFSGDGEEHNRYVLHAEFEDGRVAGAVWQHLLHHVELVAHVVCSLLNINAILEFQSDDGDVFL